MVAVGELVPNFTLPNDKGEMVSLSDFEGKRVIIYFYPKDDTPGCTTEACDFRDRIDDLDWVVIGISPDSQASHKKFREKYNLPFILLSDADKEVANLFGVYKEKNMYGKKVMGIVRSTFLVDKNGFLVQEFRNVKAEGHVSQLLEY